MKGDRFCAECDVVLDLHPQPYDANDPGCEAAEAKAERIEMVDRMIASLVWGYR